MDRQPPKFELPIAQEGMVYKIWDSLYKIVQNKYKIIIYFSFSKSIWGGAVTCTFGSSWTKEGQKLTTPKIGK